jgi:TRAP transporter 4TM/12TM fusion protein
MKKQRVWDDSDFDLEMTKYPRMGPGLRRFIAGVSILAILFSLSYVFSFNPFGDVQVDFFYLYFLLALFLPLLFLWSPARAADKNRVPWYDLLAAVLGFLIPAYFALKAEEILFGWAAIGPLHATILGCIYFVLLIEAARRAAGWIFAVVIAFFSLYPIWSDYMPGFFYCPMKFSFLRTISIHMFSPESLMGAPLHVLGETLIGYYVFAQMIGSAGAGKFFTDLAVALFGNTRAGAAKTACISSGLFGSISGSGIANVLTTGVFTIPAMKREGLPGYFAGAVEACASNGGILLPPIMGAIGFIMAQFMEVPYPTVALVAVVPALLYYAVIFMQVDAYAGLKGIKPLPILQEAPPLWRTVGRNWHIVSSIGVISYLMFALYWVDWAPWIASLWLFILTMVRKESRLKFGSIVDLFGGLGRSVSHVAALFAAIGMVMGSFVVTGLAYSFPYEVSRLAGGNVFVMLLLGAAACFILGMGIPMIGVYIFLAIVVAPGLIAAGLNEFAVHFFIVYCSCWASLTPPVATVAYVAAELAGAPPMKTGFYSMRLASAKFILPFFFVINPALILRGTSVGEELWMIGTCFFGLMLISAALEGYLWILGRVGWAGRLALFASGFLIAIPTLVSDYYGLGLGALTLLLLFMKKPKGEKGGNRVESISIH